MPVQYTIIENLHPSVVAATRDDAIKLAREYMQKHPTTTMYIVKVVSVIETTSSQKLTHLAR